MPRNAELISDVEDRQQIIVIARYIIWQGGKRRGVENNEVINPFKDRVRTVLM